jgi:hypothetical protein
MPRTTWKPHTKHGQLDSGERDELPDSVYAFPKQRKEPLTDKRHVRNALARFDQVKDVSDADRALAFANIKAAARHYGVDVAEDDWRALGRRPHTKNPTKTSAQKVANNKATKKKAAAKKKG